MIIYLLCTAVFCLAAAAIMIFLGLGPDRVASDIVAMLSPDESLRERALIARNKRKKSRIAAGILHIRRALDSSGMSSRFGAVCIGSVLLTAGGIVVSILIRNYWMMPVLAVAGASVPFFIAYGSIEAYDRRLETELETALSIITSAYIRTGDIVAAVEQNLGNIKPPVRELFASFVSRASMVTADLPACIRTLRSSSENRIFHEWCDTLIACQDDASDRFTLMPIVSKLTEIRLVNSELTTMIAGCRREYFSMVLILIANVPLLYIINRDWFDTLIHTVPGQIVTAFCGAVIVVTAFFMERFTRPVEYGKKEDDV